VLHDCVVAEVVNMGAAKSRRQLAIRVGMSKLGQVERMPTQFGTRAVVIDIAVINGDVFDSCKSRPSQLWMLLKSWVLNEAWKKPTIAESSVE